MITSSAQAVVNWLDSVQRSLWPAVEDTVGEELDLIIRNLRPVTPVDTGAMEADYTIGMGSDSWQLLNTAESPRGYLYPTRVFEDPNWSQQYGPLNETLDAGIDHMEANLDVIVSRLVERPL